MPHIQLFTCTVEALVSKFHRGVEDSCRKQQETLFSGNTVLNMPFITYLLPQYYSSLSQAHFKQNTLQVCCSSLNQESFTQQPVVPSPSFFLSHSSLPPTHFPVTLRVLSLTYSFAVARFPANGNRVRKDS